MSMNMRQVKKLKRGDCVFVCTGRQQRDGERPGFIAFVVHVTPKGGVLVENCRTQSWHPYSVVYRHELHYRDRNLRPQWAQPVNENLMSA